MASRTLKNAVAALKHLFPPGDEDLHAWENPGAWVAHDLNAKGQLLLEMWDAADDLRIELVPQTAVAKLPDWEAAFRMASSKTALFGSTAARQAQVVSRWREHGASTLANIKAALAAITGNAAAITVKEHTRAALTLAHTYSFGTITAPAGNIVSATMIVADNAPASQAGAQLTLNLSSGNPAAFTIELVAPDAQNTFLGSVIVDSGDHQYFWRQFAGGQINGQWTLFVDNTAGVVDVQIDAADLFVEGIGRADSGAEGLGANIFEWCALIDPALVTPGTFDVDLARAIVRRWNPAHCRGYLAMKASNGASSSVFDDINSTFDGCVFA